jgi:hypothetical protein
MIRRLRSVLGAVLLLAAAGVPVAVERSGLTVIEEVATLSWLQGVIRLGP